MIATVETICILAAMLPLLAGYLFSNLLSVAIGSFVVGSLWLLSEWRHWNWVAPVALFIYLIAAGMGVVLGLPPILMAISVLATLLAWDLDDFNHRLEKAAPGDDVQTLEKNHFIRLASLGIISLSLILTALFIHLRITFGWIFLLTIAAVLGLTQLVSRLRRGE